jgi:primosomal protein N''
MQYDLFNADEIERLRQECAELRQAHSNMRRGLFARHTELSRLISELREELSQIKQITAKKKAELVPFFGEYIEVIK